MAHRFFQDWASQIDSLGVGWCWKKERRSSHRQPEHSLHRRRRPDRRRAFANSSQMASRRRCRRLRSAGPVRGSVRSVAGRLPAPRPRHAGNERTRSSRPTGAAGRFAADHHYHQRRTVLRSRACAARRCCRLLRQTGGSRPFGR